MQTHVTLNCQGDIGVVTFACEEPSKPPTLALPVIATACCWADPSKFPVDRESADTGNS